MTMEEQPSESTQLRWNPKVASRTLDHQATILLQGRMLTLNEVGTFIWDTFQDGATIGEVIQAVLNSYDVTPEQATTDVYAFVGSLRERGLLVQDAHSDSPGEAE